MYSYYNISENSLLCQNKGMTDIQTFSAKPTLSGPYLTTCCRSRPWHQPWWGRGEATSHQPSARTAEHAWWSVI